MIGRTLAATSIGMMVVDISKTTMITVNPGTMPRTRTPTMTHQLGKHTSGMLMIVGRGRTNPRRLERTARKPGSSTSLKSRLLYIFWLIFIFILNTFRAKRVRQTKQKEAVGDDNEVPDDDGVVELPYDENAEVVKVIERKKKKDNNK